MQKATIDPVRTDKFRPEDKTAPSGMAPDRAHANRESAGSRRDVDTEETFDSTPDNAAATPSPRLK